MIFEFIEIRARDMKELAARSTFKVEMFGTGGVTVVHILVASRFFGGSDIFTDFTGGHEFFKLSVNGSD